MDLPFELYKNHKSITKARWKKSGLICTDEEYNVIYKRYIYSTNCELCGNEYKSRRDRHMDHSHQTGEFRNICCRTCNYKKRDVKIQSNNTSGFKYINIRNDPRYKQGFNWVFKVHIDGKRKQIKTSIDLEKVIKFRDEWFKANPDYHT